MMGIRVRPTAARARLWFWTGVFALLCAVVGPTRTAYAQEATPDAVDAATTHSQTLYRAALSAKRAKEPERALCLMERARAAWPNAAFSFNIAQLQRELGLCAEARQNYQAFLEHEREPARRQEAERALAELSACDAPRSEPAPTLAQRCTAWADAAVNPNSETQSAPPPRNDAQPNTAPTPEQVARAETLSTTSPLIAATNPRRRVPAYLPWIFAGTGVLSLGLAGYEFTRIAAAERDVEQARAWGPEQAAREQDGRTAQTLFWVFSGVGALALAGALVLVLIDREDPQPTAAATQH